MRKLWMTIALLALASGFVAAQQTAPTAPQQQDNAKPERVKVYAVGSGVTAPEILPTNLPPIPAEECKKKVDGKVTLSLLVDTAGRPRNLMFVHPLGTDLDKLALRLVAAERFKPAMHDGAPVVVAETVDVSMQACFEEKEDSAGNKIDQLRLRAGAVREYETQSHPPKNAVLAPDDSYGKESEGAYHLERIGGSVSVPVVLHVVDPRFSPEARKAKFSGICLLSVIVDAQGMPEDIRVIHVLGKGLDEKAAEAISSYRFKPAMKNGEPVPVQMAIEVYFQLYK